MALGNELRAWAVLGKRSTPRLYLLPFLEPIWFWEGDDLDIFQQHDLGHVATLLLQ